MTSSQNVCTAMKKSLTCFCLLNSPVGEDATRRAMSSFNLCTSSVFRRRLLPADEWEETHMDLPCLWQARSLWAAHYWWVRRQEMCSDVSHSLWDIHIISDLLNLATLPIIRLKFNLGPHKVYIKSKNILVKMLGFCYVKNQHELFSTFLHLQ